jgi:hypothetical protein
MYKNIREVFLSIVEVRQNPICNKKVHGYRERFLSFADSMKFADFSCTKKAKTLLYYEFNTFYLPILLSN